MVEELGSDDAHVFLSSVAHGLSLAFHHLGISLVFVDLGDSLESASFVPGLLQVSS